ncbi:COG2192 Predicted carbamoyl transferase, NodU family [uncultured Caudovirales phage]|uniref:COG2192 Predicted carbamoyl transferase, NodU family n=1 Tax=uncultured Caudovirales phage TaxID=2100421 RepID=A0A6J5TAL5_9CAUD|nr:COG2192 Predicted carbamoyl transferase, NodU family [uncultured Caudovirales phage]
MILGITAQNHDASLALIDGDKIVWAAHSERYSRRKNDTVLNHDMIAEMCEYGEPTEVVWFENPYTKSLRKLYSGQRPWYVSPTEQLEYAGIDHLPFNYVGHHESHAAAGYYTSGFQDAAILVVDAIGEWDTVSIWEGQGANITKRWSKRYPDSIGLFYTAMTQWLGLKPNEEEYILMGMAAYGKPILKEELRETFFKKWGPPNFKLRHNLHRGCQWWQSSADKFDIAASVQALVEEYLLETVFAMAMNTQSKNLVFMGGVALNCVANSLIASSRAFDNVWIMPNPGDSGSAIGAVAAHTKQHLKWEGLYLGTDIKGELDVESIVNNLLDGKVVAVANGRAEFGPRALGNRSLLCDPRGGDAKANMNTIKKREQFRPFAPAVLAEHANMYFDMPVDESPYMQFVARCRLPDLLPGIAHFDGTSRVQTVTHKDNAQFRFLLEAWYEASGCPMLMNTSLNIKGEPLVNTWADAKRFQTRHNIKIF